ncbi:MAG: T9SS type A sorting domain-containing protein, partial [Candidatus Delongbacteria bacterium]|nr:T9SS type A sorting domain-containing protein [Candidatus Delongbacteria bacterium]
WRLVVELYAKVVLFLFVLLSFFSTCIAEDFWMKLGWEESTRNVICTPQNEIFINSGDSIYRKDTVSNNWSVLNCFPRKKNYLHSIDETGNYLYVCDSYYDLYSLHKDSVNLKFLFNLDRSIISMEKCNESYYALSWGAIKKFDSDFNDYSTVLEKFSSELFTSIVESQNGMLYAGSTNFMSEEGGLYKSFDDGDSWVGPDSVLLGQFTSAMAVDSEGRIFLGTQGHYYDYTGVIFRSIDNGETWQKVAGNSVYVISMAINSDDEIFIGLDDETPPGGGVLYSADHGETWAYIGEEIIGLISEGGAGAVNDISISPDGFIYLATRAGVYRSINSTTGIEEYDTSISGFILYQNYPNPFNNETVITFDLPNACQVQLNIFNSKGELIKNFLNQKMSKGHHMVNFDAKDLRSGVYYYSLKVDNKTVSTKKMLYIR